MADTSEINNPTLKMRSSTHATVTVDLFAGVGEIGMNSDGTTASVGGDAAVLDRVAVGGSAEIGIRRQGTTYRTIDNKTRATGSDFGFLIGGAVRASVQVSRCHRLFVEAPLSIHFVNSSEWIDPYTRTPGINANGDTGYGTRAIEGTQFLYGGRLGWAFKPLSLPIGFEAKLAVNGNTTFANGVDSLSFTNVGISFGPMLATQGFCTKEKEVVKNRAAQSIKAKQVTDLPKKTSGTTDLEKAVVIPNTKEKVAVPTPVSTTPRSIFLKYDTVIEFKDVQITPKLDALLIDLNEKGEDAQGIKLLTFTLNKGDKASFSYIFDPKNDGTDQWERKSLDRSGGNLKQSIYFPESMAKEEGEHTLKIKFEGDNTVYTYTPRVKQLTPRLNITFNTNLVRTGDPAYSNKTNVTPTITIAPPRGRAFKGVIKVFAPGAQNPYIIQVDEEIVGSKKVPLNTPDRKEGEYRVVFEDQDGEVIAKKLFWIQSGF